MPTTPDFTCRIAPPPSANSALWQMRDHPEIGFRRSPSGQWTINIFEPSNPKPLTNKLAAAGITLGAHDVPLRTLASAVSTIINCSDRLIRGSVLYRIGNTGLMVYRLGKQWIIVWDPQSTVSRSTAARVAVDKWRARWEDNDIVTGGFRTRAEAIDWIQHTYESLSGSRLKMAVAWTSQLPRHRPQRMRDAERFWRRVFQADH